MAQELLTTFLADIGEIARVPCARGAFAIRIGDGCRLALEPRKDGFPTSRSLSKSFRIASLPARTWAMPIDEFDENASELSTIRVAGRE
jgi:predicted Rdx family selenoprotein